MQEETGRMYEHNTEEMNRHSPFKDTIYSSNLCQEIGLPTQGYKSVEDLYVDSGDEGEIGLCNLAAIVAGRVSESEYEAVAYRALKMVDTVISRMDYPFQHLGYTAKARRSAGVGITNLANDLAHKGFDYTSPMSKAYMHRLAEMHSFYLHKASVRLAKERGKCDWFHKTKYADGWLLIDTYSKQVDNITYQGLAKDWEGLRKEIAEHGMRNSVLEAFMPVESSSIAGNTTNGLYPIRDYVVIKTSGTNKTVFIAPDLEEVKDSYQLAWDIPMKDMTDMYAIFQKFCGQGISADYYRAFAVDKPKQISARQLLESWFYRIKCGVKSKYYSNSAAGHSLSQITDTGCASGACTL
jgi:ribonucleoside-diphosphate reductase alpha chain